MGIDEIFGNLYTCFGLENIYGAGDGELAEYLWGQASSEVTTNQFIGIGVITLFIAIFVFVAYYYVLGQLFRRPSWGNRWTWIVALLVNSFLAFIAGWQWTCSDLLAGKMKTIDAVTNSLADLPIEESNCLQFGGANALIALLFFIVLCFGFKWWSRDYSHIPF